MRIIVAESRIPGVRDGAELHAAALAAELTRRGHDVDTAVVPFRAEKSGLLDQAAAWRLLDLSGIAGRRVDAVIATRFPTYFVRHPRKVLWLIHQHRPLYDLHGTAYGDFTAAAEDEALRDRLIELDNRMLGECSRIFTNARNTASRLQRYNGVTAAPLYHPPPLAGRLREGPFGDYVLVVSRIEPVKRVDLVVRAFANVPPPTRLVIVGEGSRRAELERVAAEAAPGRVEFRGAVWGEEVARLYSGARAVVYAPFDEDYGYATLEAFLSGKPVITASDSGGTLEFVVDGENGLVCAPDPSALGAAIARLAADKELATRLGRAGLARARAITWDGVVEQLLG